MISYLAVGHKSVQSLLLDDLICSKLNTRELAEWISQCDDLKHLELIANCPFDIIQKLSVKLRALRTEVTLMDNNLGLIQKFSNLRSLHVRLEAIIWDDPLQRERLFFEAVVKLDGLETLILENFSLELNVISRELEKGKLRFLKNLEIPYASSLSAGYESDFAYVETIAHTLKSLRYLVFDTTYDINGIIIVFIHGLKALFPHINFLTHPL